MYLNADELIAKKVHVEFIEEKLKNLFTEMDTTKRAEAYAGLLEYGMYKEEVGVKTAAVLFKKIISSNAA